MRAKLVQGAVIGFAAALLATVLRIGGTLERIEAVTWDWRARTMAAPGAATDDIVLILLDQASLSWAETTMGLGWPWPREVYSAILGFCQQGRARAIAFDVLFTEASDYADQDAALGTAIVAGVPFVGTVFFEGTNAILPIADVRTNATQLGSIMGDAAPDGVIRRIRTSMTYDGVSYPTLGLAVIDAVDSVTMPALPGDDAGRVILRWRGDTQTHAAYSAQAVIQSFLRLQAGATPVLQPDVVADKYVFFGFTAPGLMDLRSTPLSPVYPGVEVHATLLDNALSHDLIRDAPPWFVLATALLFGLLAGLTGRHCGKAWQVVVGFVILLPLPLLLGLAGYQAGWWLPVAAPTVAGGLGLIGSVVMNYAVEGRQKRFIKGAFKQYLSPAVIDRLMADPDRLSLGGELRELSIFFSDVAGFTGISEHLGPAALTSLLNTYLTAMTDIVLEEGGTIDKYEGDAIIAFWNAPLDLHDHPRAAVRAAMRCQAKLAAMRPQLRATYGKAVTARIGINTGPVVVGNMGSEQRFDYTFLGDAGNLAARLEGINKQFDTAILISEFTVARLDDSIPMREISRVRVVGRKEPVRVYSPLTESTDPTPFAAALNSYYTGAFADASAQFETLAASDPTAAIYARRCRHLAVNPPASWDGVWKMTEK